tara:strand:- start:1298 stop:1465 length:168 start_codon:yes stop_codon:yes gene_type:complete
MPYPQTTAEAVADVVKNAPHAYRSLNPEEKILWVNRAVALAVLQNRVVLTDLLTA